VFSWDHQQSQVQDVLTSCNIFDARGLMRDFCIPTRPNIGASISHSGLKPGNGDDEFVTADLPTVTPHIAALIFSMHCPTTGDFSQLVNGVATLVVEGKSVSQIQVPPTPGTTSVVLFTLTRTDTDGDWLICPGPTIPTQDRHPTEYAKQMMSLLDLSTSLKEKLMKMVPEVRGARGQLIPIPPNMEFVAAGAGWQGDVDVDLSAIAIDNYGRMAVVVKFTDLSEFDGAIKHTGDKMHGDALPDKDDEVINVDLPRLPYRIAAVFFVLNIYRGEQTFDDIANERCRIWYRTPDGEASEFCRVDGEDSGTKKGFIFACVMRDMEMRKTWNFHFVGIEHEGRQAESLVDDCEKWFQKRVKADGGRMPYYYTPDDKGESSVPAGDQAASSCGCCALM